MTASLSLILAAAAMIGCGVYLVLERSLTRVLVGLCCSATASTCCS